MKSYKYKYLISALALSTIALGGCSGVQQASGDVTFSIPSKTGTRLPKNPERLFNEGFTTPREVINVFGDPQMVQDFEWGKILTYRYQEIGLLGQKYDEFVEFAFSPNGFLQDVIQYSGPTIVDKSIEMEKDEKCPPQYALCQSFKPSKS